MFGFGMQKTINRGVFRNMPRRDQDAFLQYVYDEGYSVKEISREYGIPVQTLYTRINAHRGRGPLLT
ncbi:TPA: sigma-70 region 4 domain-containing protein [Vibrio parahaemolyticus]|nr:sigma-70 region 4 domain-containing protein [Vibrio parahaemolyticus]HCH4305833.1 sigma-70 region 4 domain-containing protein [Vibrio parahaemolyticus]HCH5629473.1 sigma-70 region 4 domain-containing protein [Vibrio parahaemolyticus]HCH5754371.1 sigma-70 region 4 domain-containing protein [Vibrio parahaemolyticus]HCM1522746.1 sigma-70 region 4 domain-containing protein [Vibrio parahaemolyticus]